MSPKDDVSSYQKDKMTLWEEQRSATDRFDCRGSEETAETCNSSVKSAKLFRRCAGAKGLSKGRGASFPDFLG